MIKLCIISPGAYSLFYPSSTRTFGGSEVQLFILAQELAKNPSVDVHVIVGNFGQDDAGVHDRITLHRGTPPWPLKWLDILLPYTKIFLFPPLRKVQADIVIQRSASAGTGLICFLLHLWRKKFIYMTAHEIDCNGEFERQNSWLTGKLFQYGIRHADCIVTQSQEHADMIAKHHKRQSIVMPSLYTIPSAEELAHITKKYILWVGRCEDWKRPEVFIELARSHPEEQFIMICPKSNNQSEYYLSIQNQLTHAPQNLRHVPYVPFAEIDQYFKEAKLFVNTSTYEGFPNTFVQAIKNKTPILSLAVNPDSFLEKARCGASAQNDVQKLGQLFDQYMKDPTMLQTFGEHGYAHARSSHNSEAITRRYIDLFRKILNTRS